MTTKISEFADNLFGFITLLAESKYFISVLRYVSSNDIVYFSPHALFSQARSHILHQPGSALCHLFGCHVESVDHILSSCSTIVQTWLYYCNYHQKTTYMIDIRSCPYGQQAYSEGEWEAWEIHRSDDWTGIFMFTPLIIGRLGSVLMCLVKNLKT